MNDFSLVWHELVYYRKIILQFGKRIGWEISETRDNDIIKYLKNRTEIQRNFHVGFLLFPP